MGGLLGNDVSCKQLDRGRSFAFSPSRLYFHLENHTRVRYQYQYLLCAVCGMEGGVLLRTVLVPLWRCWIIIIIIILSNSTFNKML